MNTMEKQFTTHPLETPLQYIKGVGPRLAEKLRKKNLNTVKDILHFYPRAYLNQKTVDDPQSLSKGQYAVLEGEIFQKTIKKGFKGRRFYTLIVRTYKDKFFCIKYFKLPFKGFFDSMEVGLKIKIGGWVYFYNNIPEFHHPDFFSPQEDSLDTLPVYSEIEGVSQKKIRQIMDVVLNQFSIHKFYEEEIPLETIKEFDLLPYAKSLKDIHQPQYTSDLYLKCRAPSQKTLIFEEFFKLQLNWALKKMQIRQRPAFSVMNEDTLNQRFLRELSFEPTQAQNKVLNEIKKDMKKSCPMQRLLQGDVGSGKTLVAFQSCLYAVESGLQAVIMAPTEILAEQHYKNAKKMMADLNIKIELLTSRISDKTSVKGRLKNGQIDLCIGTHALIQDPVEFKKLGIAVIDEQHRFGVHQRRELLQKNKNFLPHCLIMTATPIPRTLSMALYGDLDVSVIDEMPKGRSVIVTKKTNKRREVFLFLEKEILKGRQAYVIHPLVEESEHIDLKNALEQFEKLQKAFPKIKWGLIHGRMNFEDKSKTMSRFKKGDIQALVSTTVVEVGVDVPNASVIVIENSERFGLSQLHQLRGRVGRGACKSYCILIYEEKNLSSDSMARLKAMEQFLDGFRLSQMDLELRGAGEFLGVRQSGFMNFKLAHLVRDIEIQKQAKRAVQLFLDKDPSFEKHSGLKEKMFKISEIRLT